jgi:chromosome segregation ATPase
MNEKNYIFIVIIIVLVIAGFCTGYYFGNRSTVRETGQSDNEFRAELEVKQRRIDELEAERNYFRNMVSDACRDIGGIIDRISGHDNDALQTAGDIRATAGLIQEAVKKLENSELYFRELANRLSGGEYHSRNE